MDYPEAYLTRLPHYMREVCHAERVTILMLRKRRNARLFLSKLIVMQSCELIFMYNQY